MPNRDKQVAIDDETLERLHRGILLRTGAYLTDSHIALRSGRHTSEYVAKALVTTEPTFTEGLGDIIATHFSRSPVDLVLTTGYGAGLLGHCVARAHPARPRFIFATKGKTPTGRTEVELRAEYRAFFAEGGRVLIVEDIVTTGETVKQLIRLVESMGGQVVGVGAIWRRNPVVKFKYPLFTIVSRDVPTYAPEDCPMCKRGMPITPDDDLAPAE
ncbi:MAG TPA: phosphoribosyltransferase family protein [Candidatus Sulfotelmatobacter sp.]|nr:phosphoribosyltransferase family protein [Candidatus Sulfotelmatobacter sp.]